LRRELDRWHQNMIDKINHDVIAIMEMLNTRIDKWKDDKINWNTLDRSDKILVVKETIDRLGSKMEAAKELGIAKKTLYRYLNQTKQSPESDKSEKVVPLKFGKPGKLKK
jgi:hypothetical protein